MAGARPARWVPRWCRGASPSACRGVLIDGRRDGMGEGKVGVRTRAGRESATHGQVAGQRARACSGAASGSGALECLSAQCRGGSARERERRERKGVERENKSQRFDSVQTQDFQLKLEKF